MMKKTTLLKNVEAYANSAESQVKRLRTSSTKSWYAVKALKEKNDRLEEENAILRTSLPQQVTSEVYATVAALKKELEFYKSECRTRLKYRDSLQTTNDSLTRANENLRRCLEHTEAQVAVLQRSLGKTMSENKELLNTIEDMRSGQEELQRGWNERMQSLEEELWEARKLNEAPKEIEPSLGSCATLTVDFPDGAQSIEASKIIGDMIHEEFIPLIQDRIRDLARDNFEVFFPATKERVQMKSPFVYALKVLLEEWRKKVSNYERDLKEASISEYSTIACRLEEMRECHNYLKNLMDKYTD